MNMTIGILPIFHKSRFDMKLSYFILFYSECPRTNRDSCVAVAKIWGASAPAKQVLVLEEGLQKDD